MLFRSYSAYKKKAELLAFIKKCTKNNTVCSGYYKLKKVVKKEQAQLPVQPPSRIKKSQVNYENHIVQIFNEMNSTFEPKTINPIALRQINEFLNVLAKTILDEAYSIVVIEGRDSITSREIQEVVRLIFVGELCNKGVSYADCRIENQVELQFPIEMTLFEKYGSCERSAGVYLTAIVEYIAIELLDIAVYFGPERVEKELSIKQVKLAVEQDPEFVSLLESLKFNFKM